MSFGDQGRVRVGSGGLVNEGFEQVKTFTAGSPKAVVVGGGTGREVGVGDEDPF